MSSSKKVKRDEYEKAASTSRSEEELSGNERAGEPKPKMSKKMKNYLAILIVVLLTGSGGYYYIIQPSFKGKVVLNDPYDFQVYCPVNKVPQNIRQSGNIDKTPKEKGNDDLRFLTEEVYQKVNNDDSEVDMYIIWVQMRRVNASTNYSKLLYCSYMTDWQSKNCSNAKQMCTLPGAMFYVEKDRPIDVAWVHDIINEDGSKVFQNELGCIKKNQSEKDKKKCTLHRKKDQSENCTYLSPTNQIPANTYTLDFEANLKNMPMVTHVHGL